MPIRTSLSLAYRLFGVHAWTAFAVNAAVMALTVCAVYLLVCVLFRDRDAALFAGLLDRAHAAAADVVGDGGGRAVGVARPRRRAPVRARYYLRRGTAARWRGRVAAAYAVQFRPESLLILPSSGCVVWPRPAGELERPRGWWAVMLFLCLVAVHAGAPVCGPATSSGGLTGRGSRSDTLPANLRVNGWFYLYDERFPVAFTLLAIAGLLSAEPLAASVRRWRSTSCCSSRSIWCSMPGSYNYGADVRYSLMTYPPIAVLGGLGRVAAHRGMSQAGADRVHSAIGYGTHRRHSAVPVPLVCAGRSRDDRRSVGGPGRRAVCAGLRRCAFRRNSYVLTHNPGMFHVWGVNAGQMSLVTSNPAYLRFSPIAIPAASICTGTSGATCRIPRSRRSAGRR